MSQVSSKGRGGVRAHKACPFQFKATLKYQDIPDKTYLFTQRSCTCARITYAIYNKNDVTRHLCKPPWMRIPWLGGIFPSFERGSFWSRFRPCACWTHVLVLYNRWLVYPCPELHFDLRYTTISAFESYADLPYTKVSAFEDTSVNPKDTYTHATTTPTDEDTWVITRITRTLELHYNIRLRRFTSCPKLHPHSHSTTICAFEDTPGILNYTYTITALQRSFLNCAGVVTHHSNAFLTPFVLIFFFCFRLFSANTPIFCEQTEGRNCVFCRWCSTPWRQEHGCRVNLRHVC